MSHEVEAAAIGSLGGLFGREHHHQIPAGARCDNCGVELQGEWCHRCGQEFGQPRRSILHLTYEVFEGLFHADGRLWKTLPRLALNPGQLTTDFIAGKRAPQAPPFSIFLVVVVMFIFVGALTQEHSPGYVHPRSAEAAKNLAAMTPGPDDIALVSWIKARGRIALEQPERFTLVAETWEHRIAIAMLPISALLLTLLFAFQRRFMIYDHLVFSMHSLAFAGMVLTVWMLATLVVGYWANWLWLLLPIHLFAHMRGAYQTSVAGTLTRMGLLFVGSLIAYSLLLFVLVLISLSAMTP